MMTDWRPVVRSITRLAVLLWVIGTALFMPWQPVRAGVPVTLYQSFSGNLNYTATGGTLRTQSNSGNPCAVTGSRSAALSGIPAGSTITAAYLYWAGSGSTPDYNVTLDGAAISADRRFTEIFSTGGTDYDFFSGFEDVTARVAAKGNGTYTFAGLTVNNGQPHCSVSAVLSGWSLLVIYENAAEPLRTVNVFDGFQYFRGGILSLTASNFVIPGSGIDGKQGVLTWEGDFENSTALNGFSETLTFNGTALTDGLNPANNQFNSTINLLGSNTSYGVDLDNYDITSLLGAGDTTATTVYSSGADLVLLSMEVLSVTSTLFTDLAISKTHSGNFSVGQNGVYTLGVSNNGPFAEYGAITVTDTLPAGTGYVSATGTGWSCGATGQDVTCVHAGPLTSGAALPAITLTVSVAAAAAPGVTNTAVVSGTQPDNQPGNNSSSDTAVVQQPDLSTSTKTVVDVNGGDADPGDVLRYTITLIESNGVAAANVSVTDNVPANTTNLNLVSWPAGATDNSTGVLLDISGIALPPGGSDTIVFEVTVAGGASPGDTIDNTATITNPNGPGASPAAPTVFVSASQIAAGGNKPLYLHTGTLSRIVPAALGDVTINEGNTASWTLNPALATALTVDGSSGSIPVTLVLGEAGNSQLRSYTISLSSSAIGTFATLSLTNVDLDPVITATYNLALTTPGDKTLPAGSAITLTVVNTSSGSSNRRVIVTPNGSFVNLPSRTVINVDSVQFYDAAYPGGAPITTALPGNTVRARAVVSDPFGSFDITSAVITLRDPAGNPVASGAPMTLVADSGAATRTYEYAYTIPVSGPEGVWSARVTAHEGSEGVISHQGNASVAVSAASLTLLKSVQTVSDPLNGTVNPYNIPGAKLLYTLQISNSGAGSTDADTVVISDMIPVNTALQVTDVGGAGSGPVLFIDGSPSSGLTYTFTSLASQTDDLEFSIDGTDWTYIPTADASGLDGSVRYLRVRPGSAMPGNTGGGDPNFQIRFMVDVQ